MPEFEEYDRGNRSQSEATEATQKNGYQSSKRSGVIEYSPQRRGTGNVRERASARKRARRTQSRINPKEAAKQGSRALKKKYTLSGPTGPGFFDRLKSFLSDLFKSEEKKPEAKEEVRPERPRRRRSRSGSNRNRNNQQGQGERRNRKGGQQRNRGGKRGDSRQPQKPKSDRNRNKNTDNPKSGGNEEKPSQGKRRRPRRRRRSNRSNNDSSSPKGNQQDK